MAELSSPLARLATFRGELYAGCTRRADALLELADALLFAQAIPSVAPLHLGTDVSEHEGAASGRRSESRGNRQRAGAHRREGDDRRGRG
jgi:hypothetical protein